MTEAAGGRSDGAGGGKAVSEMSEDGVNVGDSPCNNSRSGASLRIPMPGTSSKLYAEDCNTTP